MNSHPLREYRKKHGLTQIELGETLTISHASVSRIEAGKQEVTLELAVKCEERLGIPRLLVLYPYTTRKNHSNSIIKRICKKFSYVVPRTPK